MSIHNNLFIIFFFSLQRLSQKHRKYSEYGKIWCWSEITLLVNSLCSGSWNRTITFLLWGMYCYSNTAFDAQNILCCGISLPLLYFPPPPPHLSLYFLSISLSLAGCLLLLFLLFSSYPGKIFSFNVSHAFSSSTASQHFHLFPTAVVFFSRLLMLLLLFSLPAPQLSHRVKIQKRQKTFIPFISHILSCYVDFLVLCLYVAVTDLQFLSRAWSWCCCCRYLFICLLLVSLNSIILNMKREW